jgi:hypothetical protein
VYVSSIGTIEITTTCYFLSKQVHTHTIICELSVAQLHTRARRHENLLSQSLSEVLIVIGCVHIFIRISVRTYMRTSTSVLCLKEYTIIYIGNCILIFTIQVCIPYKSIGIFDETQQ